MVVELGKYKLYIDNYDNHYITEKTIVKDGKHKGSEKEVRVSGFCATPKQALESFIKRRIGESDATTLEQAIDDIENARNEALKIVEALNERNIG